MVYALRCRGKLALLGLTGLLLAVMPSRLLGAEDDLVMQALREGNRPAARDHAEKLVQDSLTRTRPAQYGRLSLLGTCFKTWSDFPDAEHYYQRARTLAGDLDVDQDLGQIKLKDGRSIPVPQVQAAALKHLYISEAEMNLGVLYIAEEDYMQSGVHLERCRRELAQAGATSGTRWGDFFLLLTATLQQNRGRLHELMGEYVDAERCYNAGQRVLLGQGESRPAKPELAKRYADLLNSRGWLLASSSNREKTAGHQEDARQLLSRAFADVEAADALWKELGLPANDPRVLRSLNNHALLHYFRGGQGDDAEAQALLERSVALLEEKNAVGPARAEVAKFKHNLASVLRSRGEMSTARRRQLESLNTFTTLAEGKTGPDVADGLAYLAWLDVASRNWAAAADEMDGARHLFRQHLRGVLSVQSDSQQLAFLQTKDRPQFQAALTLAVRALVGREGALHADQEQRLRTQSAEWLLNGKSITGEILAERMLLARTLAGRDREIGDVYANLRAVRDQLGARSLRKNQAQQNGDQAAERLVEREGQLSRQLALALPARPQASWVTLEQVQRTLAQDPDLDGQGILIDIARFNYVDFQSKGTDFFGSAQRYAAWVIPPEGAVQVFDLGDAAEIDGLVNDLRVEMENSYLGHTVRDGRTVTEAGKGTIHTEGDVESEQRFRARSRALANRLLGPMYPLISKKERWLISPDGDLWLVPWAALVLPGGDKFTPYAVENHTLSLLSSGRDIVAPLPKNVQRSAPLILADPDFGKRVPGKNGLSFGTLALTRFEADEAAPLIRQYTNTREEVVPILGAAAQERVFRQAHSPKVVLLGTHGFFLDQAEGRLANPFMRCGLAMAGANQRESLDLSAASAQNDGLLLGQEILDTDLRATDLVVLSACDTAVGNVRGGEGVANLQSAFQLAGAQSVVGTLWEVEEEATALLTRDFFKNLAVNKMDKALALRQAQRGRIEVLRKTKKAAHPFFWGAMTLTGRWAKTLED
jgi:CHAT domain-containing protein/tetratricopeptide (TPR) repeat protein